MYIAIERMLDKSELSSVLMRFYVFVDMEIDVVLDVYHIRSRPTKRHGWRIDKRWERLCSRDNNIDKPDLDAPTRAEAEQRVRERVFYKEKKQ